MVRGIPFWEGVRGSLSSTMTFEQRPGGSESVSCADTWGKSIPSRGTISVTVVASLQEGLKDCCFRIHMYPSVVPFHIEKS